MQRSVLALLAATGLGAIAAPQTGDAQSFDCAKAGTAIEKRICSDPDLGAMDSALGAVYARLRGSLSGDAASALQASEREWVQQRNACDPESDCVTQAYVQRLGALDRQYDVFAGWQGSFESRAGLQIAITGEDGGGYQLALSGAGQNWTCDGTLSATPGGDGMTLSVGQGGTSASLQAAGTGVWIPAAMDELVASTGFCGAAAPVVSGFFARSAHAAVPGFQQAPFIRPQIVKALTSWLSDSGDQVVAINLTASQDSNRFAGDVKVAPDAEGGPPMVSMTDGTDQFAYRYVGTMTNGIHVLATFDGSTDGSGVFPSLMFLSFREDHGIAADWDAKTIGQGAARRLLVKHGEILPGVQWSGEAKVEGNRVYVGGAGSGGGEARSGWLSFDATGAPAQ